MDDCKLYPVVVRYFDQSLGRIVCSLLTMVEWKEASTGENIFKLLDQELTLKRRIPWSNCVSFSSDNASVMSGMGKGVAGHISRTQPSVYFMGCACHLMNIAAQKAASELPCSASDVIIDIYYYLDKSANRKQNLKQFQCLYGKDTQKILQLVNTRWLSLGQCLNSILEMWTPLKSYFRNEEKKIDGKTKGKHTNITIKPKDSSAKSKTTSSKNKDCCTKPNDTASSARPTVKPSDNTAKPQPQSQAFDLSSYLFKQKELQTQKDNQTRQSTKVESKTYAQRKVEKVSTFLSGRTNRLYCLFLQGAIPLFEQANLVLQKEDLSALGFLSRRSGFDYRSLQVIPFHENLTIMSIFLHMWRSCRVLMEEVSTG